MYYIKLIASYEENVSLEAQTTETSHNNLGKGKAFRLVFGLTSFGSDKGPFALFKSFASMKLMFFVWKL